MAKREKHDKRYVFAEMPIGRAVAYLVVPTVLTQVISILYNLADTFFIGKLEQPELVAACGICMPAMLFMTALANLFGVGASSAISRALGSGDDDRARLASSFSFWCGLLVAAVYILLSTFARGPFMALLGADASTAPYVNTYLNWTLTCGGVFFFLASLLAHFTRTIGKSVAASIGVSSGAVLNIVLDPVFLFVFNMGIEGVAIASLIGQVLSVLILAGHLLAIRGGDTIRPVPTTRAFTCGVGSEIVQIGVVSFCMTALAQVSNVCVNLLVSPNGAEYVAASSVAIKLNVGVFQLCQGLTLGVLPLIGFNYSAGNASRVKGAIKVMVAFAVCIGGICMVLSLLFPEQIIAFFINDSVTIAAGRSYITAVALCMIPASLVFAATSYMQAIGQKRRPYILAFTRMGTVDVLFMILCSHVLGPAGILFGKPMADWLCVCTACVVLNNLRKHTNPFCAEQTPQETK